MPPNAIMRRTDTGKLSAHGQPGVPPTATAFPSGGGQWTVDGPGGRAFVASELLARRLLWQAVVQPMLESESGTLT